MIQKIEKLRKLHKISKLELCRECGVSVQMYSKYIKGSQITVDKAEKMLKYMGYELRILIL